VILSAVTIWGEELLPRVPLLPLRRLDVFKACFNFLGLAAVERRRFSSALRRYEVCIERAQERAAQLLLLLSPENGFRRRESYVLHFPFRPTRDAI
jgi:hypothetical protein